MSSKKPASGRENTQDMIHTKLGMKNWRTTIKSKEKLSNPMPW